MNTLKKKMNKKGFTLAELLIVVAIIAVLVAISIPIFTSQLEKSRDAVTVANIRAAYAEAASEVLTNSAGGSGTTLTVKKTVTCKGKQTGLSDLEKELPIDSAGKTYVSTNCGAANADVEIQFKWTTDASGITTVTVEAPTPVGP